MKNQPEKYTFDQDFNYIHQQSRKEKAQLCKGRREPTNQNGNVALQIVVMSVLAMFVSAVLGISGI